MTARRMAFLLFGSIRPLLAARRHFSRIGGWLKFLAVSPPMQLRPWPGDDHRDNPVTRGHIAAVPALGMAEHEPIGLLCIVNSGMARQHRAPRDIAVMRLRDRQERTDLQRVFGALPVHRRIEKASALLALRTADKPAARRQALAAKLAA